MGESSDLLRICHCIPDDHHVVVHLLQLLLGHLEGVGWWVEFVGLEALIAEPDLERLIFGLVGTAASVNKTIFNTSELLGCIKCKKSKRPVAISTHLGDGALVDLRRSRICCDGPPGGDRCSLSALSSAEWRCPRYPDCSREHCVVCGGVKVVWREEEEKKGAEIRTRNMRNRSKKFWLLLFLLHSWPGRCLRKRATQFLALGQLNDAC